MHTSIFFTLLLIIFSVFCPVRTKTSVDIEEFFNQIDTLQENTTQHPDAGLNITEFLKKYNYTLESHSVTTEDGYILGLHRIPNGQNEDNSREDSESPKPVVLLMHGLLSSSMDFVNMGPGNALGLLLADEGYDVWLGNSRGNTWSRHHKTLDPDGENTTFWDFSFHEMGYYDLPAIVDYIIVQTGVKQISYVGHSQGTAQFWVFLSERPEYNDKINRMVALAPVAFFQHLKHPLLNLMRNHFDQIFEFLREKGWEEIMPHIAGISEKLVTLCTHDKLKSICSVLVELLAGFDSDEWDDTFAQVIVSNAPAGASVKQLKHFGQGITYGNFRKYDNGVIQNMEIYGNSTPPEYDLSKVTANLTFYYSEYDWFASHQDVDILSSKLTNSAVEKILMESKKFSHLDYIFAKHLFTLLNSDVVQKLNEANRLVSTTTESDITTTTTVTPKPNGSTSISANCFILTLIVIFGLLKN